MKVIVPVVLSLVATALAVAIGAVVTRLRERRSTVGLPSAADPSIAAV